MRIACVVPVAEVAERAVDLTTPVIAGGDAGQLGGGGGTDRQAVPVVGEDVELDHLVGGEGAGTVELGHYRMHPAGVVPDHAAEGVAVVRRGIRSERETVRRGGVAQLVEVAAGFDDRVLRLGIDRAHPVEVLGEVDDDGDVGALSGEARSAAAAGNRDPRVGDMQRRWRSRRRSIAAPRRRSALADSWTRRWNTSRGFRRRSGPRPQSTASSSAASARASSPARREIVTGVTVSMPSKRRAGITGCASSSERVGVGALELDAEPGSVGIGV